MNPEIDLNITVLKFGGSVLASRTRLPIALHEIYREVRAGRRVVAVVSALGDTTDRLLADIQRQFQRPAAALTARLLETGETVSAAYLALLLDEAGVPAELLDPQQAGLRSRGPSLDAEPLGLDVTAFQRALAQVPVVVTPGFAGRDRWQRPTVFGRGGSDYTALFLAQRLAARDCRLIKDVDGLHPRERSGGLDPRLRYASASYAEVSRLGEGLVQSKAVDFAASHGLHFTLAAPGSPGGTRVGDLPNRLAIVPSCHPLRVGLAGLGSVGLGVYRWLQLWPGNFRVCGILVRDGHKLRPADVPPVLLSTRLDDWLATDPDIVVEVTGGVTVAGELAAIARQRGLPLINANKQLLATENDWLQRLARNDTADFRCAASVGGSLPLLERLAHVRREQPIVSITGVLNGTCNFILDRMAAGLDLAAAVAEAQAQGLAESDPSLDISGLDSAYKLAVVCAVAFGQVVPPATITVEGLTELQPDRLRLTTFEGRRLRLVASAQRDGHTVRAAVRLRSVAAADPLARCCGEQNLVRIGLRDGQQLTLAGKGAGRWPTALAVLADLLDVHREVIARQGRAERSRRAVGEVGS
ncbi:MAG: homoserine dehydrogenase [bacterium]